MMTPNNTSKKQTSLVEDRNLLQAKSLKLEKIMNEKMSKRRLEIRDLQKQEKEEKQLLICKFTINKLLYQFLNLQYTYDDPKQHFQEEKYSSWQRSLMGSQRLFFVKFQKLLC